MEYHDQVKVMRHLKATVETGGSGAVGARRWVEHCTHVFYITSFDGQMEHSHPEHHRGEQHQSPEPPPEQHWSGGCTQDQLCPPGRSGQWVHWEQQKQPLWRGELLLLESLQTAGLFLFSSTLKVKEEVFLSNKSTCCYQSTGCCPHIMDSNSIEQYHYQIL